MGFWVDGAGLCAILCPVAFSCKYTGGQRCGARTLPGLHCTQGGPTVATIQNKLSSEGVSATCQHCTGLWTKPARIGPQNAVPWRPLELSQQKWVCGLLAKHAPCMHRVRSVPTNQPCSGPNMGPQSSGRRYVHAINLPLAVPHGNICMLVCISQTSPWQSWPPAIPPNVCTESFPMALPPATPTAPLKR